MNTHRFIWITTTILFSLVGLIVGNGLGDLYIQHFEGNSPSHFLNGKPMGLAVRATLSISLAIVLARLGSWVADRFIINGLRHFQNMSAADRVLSIVGGLLGLLFGVLVTLPLLSFPDKFLWVPVQLCVMAVTSALGMALLQGMRSEMLRVLPQLEPSEEEHQLPRGGSRPKLLDTNVIIDGRMADLCKTGFIEGPLHVPNFVLDEVQYIADSADSMRRSRGRRGLEVLNTMREIMVPQLVHGQIVEVPLVDVLTEIPPSVQKIDTVDSKLVGLAKELRAAIVTNDFNLNRVAELQGVKVLNINELAQSLKPVVLPGEEMDLTIVKEGKEMGQGVGYLDDGTMVVVSDGNRHVGETCKVVISSVYQTVAGKMIFADIKGTKGAGDDLFGGPTNAAGNSNGRRESGDDFSNRTGGGVRRKNKA